MGRGRRWLRGAGLVAVVLIASAAWVIARRSQQRIPRSPGPSAAVAGRRNPRVLVKPPSRGAGKSPSEVDGAGADAEYPPAIDDSRQAREIAAITVAGKRAIGPGETGRGGRSPAELVPPTETALMQGQRGGDRPRSGSAVGSTRGAKRDKALSEARRALDQGSAYHLKRDYRSAAACYQRAVTAAERADDARLRADALVQLGAVMAELGETKEARKCLELAARVAHQAGYVEGERNARVQLRLLDEQQDKAIR